MSVVSPKNREIQLMYDLQRLYKDFFKLVNLQYGHKRGGGSYLYIDPKVSSSPQLIRLVNIINKYEKELREFK